MSYQMVLGFLQFGIFLLEETKKIMSFEALLAVAETVAITNPTSNNADPNLTLKHAFEICCLIFELKKSH